jgi:hypothetical protein
MGLSRRDPAMGERWCVLNLDSEKDPLILRQAAKLLVRENERLTDRVVALTSEVLALKGASPADLQLQLAQLEAQLAVKNKLLLNPTRNPSPGARLRHPGLERARDGRAGASRLPR